MPPVIPQCRADDDPDVMSAQLADAGCLVVCDMVGSEVVSAVRTELAGRIEAAVAGEDDPAEFCPNRTHR